MCAFLVCFFAVPTFLFYFQVLCSGISVYADNMLCLDLCAVPKDLARRVIGSTVRQCVLCVAMECRRMGVSQDGRGKESCVAVKQCVNKT